MGYPRRIESAVLPTFVTTRTRNCELWFINNPALERAILASAAKYSNTYDVNLYGLALEGTHSHAAAGFPKMNRYAFMRDFNSATAKAVQRLTPEYPGGRLFDQRYSGEVLCPRTEDIENYVFYLALQPVQDGLVQKISDSPGYNFFHDAVWGIERKFKVVCWKRYNAARKRNPATPIAKYTETFTLKYDRIPGYEALTQKEYAVMMLKKLEERRCVIVAARLAAGKGFAGLEKLRKIKRGTRAKNPKRSHPMKHRPRVLSLDNATRAHYRDEYFEKQSRFKTASKLYRSGKLDTVFPEGMFRPCINPPPPPDT